MLLKNPLSIPKIGFLFFLLSIFFLPVDSFPLFPMDTVYRPLSIVFLVIPLFLYILKGRLHFYTPWLILASFFIFTHSLISTELLFEKNEHIKKAGLTLFLLVILLVSLFTIINDGLKNNKEVFFDFLGVSAFCALVLMIAVAFVQILMKIGFLPVYVSDQVTHLFSYRSSQRVQSVAGEPAQMVRSLVLLIALVYFFYFKSFRKLMLFSGFIVLILSGSTYGYLTIFLMFIVFFIFFKPSYIFNKKILLLFFILSISFSFLRESFLDDYTNAKIDAVWSVFSSMSFDMLSVVLQSDGSIFQRAINPTIGFMSGPYSNFLGVGLDGYRYVYPEIINQYFPYALNFAMVEDAVYGDAYITPKSLYSKVFSELGIVPFLLMFFYYFWLFFAIKKKHKVIGFPHFLFVYILIIPLNTDSIIYFNYVFSLVLLHLIVKKHCS